MGFRVSPSVFTHAGSPGFDAVYTITAQVIPD